jgi:mono/diheme cytochrome c family protein
VRHALSVLAFVLVVSTGARAQIRDKQSFEFIEHGRYMTTAADCTACHTAPGGQPFAGGGALETPFGTLLAPNITPDVQTGIGGWTDDEFVQALQNGVGHGGIHLYPAMPYTYYTKMRRDDVLSMRAYLDTVQPVHNRVIANQLPFPFNQRESMVGWDALYFKRGEFKPDAGKSAEWNRGAYLVEGPEHCGLCHTPKNALGGDDDSRAMQGSVLQNWYASDLTANSRVGLGDWSIQDVILYLETGRNRFEISSGPMADAITHSLSHLAEADLKAIAVYVKSLPSAGGAAPTPISMEDPKMKQGRAIYHDNCSACHGGQGQGIVGLFPRLAKAPLVQQEQPTSMIRVVLEGSRAIATAGAPTGPAMPSYAWKLSDDDVAALLTYVRNAWGNAAPAVQPGDVGKMQTALHREAQQSP